MPIRETALTLLVASAPVFLVLDGALSRLDGILLIALYVLYVFLVARDAPRGVVGKKRDLHKVVRGLALFAIGAALLILASEGIVVIAHAAHASLGIAPFLLGVFAVAFSTSFPELAFGIRAALSGTPELSAADVVGSCAVNGTAIIGMVALVHPIVPAASEAAAATGLFGLLVFLAYFLTVGIQPPTRMRGLILLLLYFLFTTFSVLR